MSRDPSRRERMAALGRDAEYLAFKESIGERLSPGEQAILDAYRQRLHYRAFKEALEAPRDPAPRAGGAS